MTPTVQAAPRRGFRAFFAKLIRHPIALPAFVVLLVFIVMAVFPALFTDHSPSQQDLRARFLAPGLGERGARLGTDHLGRDVLARIAHGARTSLLVALASFLGAGFIGLVVGVLSGYYGGWLDDLVTFWINVQLGFPFLLVAMVLLVFIRPGTASIVLVLVITTWVLYARVVRGVVLSVRELSFVEAARSLGGRDAYLLLRHVLPNVLTPFLVIGTLEMARVVILEASLSFLGLGVPPPTPTWGGMLAEGRRYMFTAPWLATIPGLAITLLVISINTLGDFLRDFVDPGLRV